MPARFSVPAVAVLLALCLGACPAVAQDPGKTDAQPTPPVAAPAANWATSCSAATRAAPLDCSIEQRVVLKETGQQLARMVIKIGGGEQRSAGLLVQLPLGLSIRNGLALTVDGKQLGKFDIQTCDAGGCYAGAQLSAELLAAMKSGKELKAEFQDLQQKPIAVAFVLAGFTAAYAAVE